MIRIALLALGCIAVGAAACGGSSGPSTHFNATMNSANEVPTPTVTTGSGTATYTLNGSTVNYTVTYNNLSGPPTAAHIHLAPAGVRGGVVVPFTGLPATASGTFSGTFSAADVAGGFSDAGTGMSIDAGNLNDLINQMRLGNTYTNVHTTANGGGEIRGQNQAQ